MTEEERRAMLGAVCRLTADGVRGSSRLLQECGCDPVAGQAMMLVALARMVAGVIASGPVETHQELVRLHADAVRENIVRLRGEASTGTVQ